MTKLRWALVTVAALSIFAFGINAALKMRAEQKRQIQYQSLLDKYSYALKPGLTRQQAESYLHSNGLAFRQMCCVGPRRSAWADLVKVGQEKPPWFCNQYNVYVALQFEAREPNMLAPAAQDSDRLEEVTLFPWLEECL